jgi:prepilin-type N-terminal cleavage/methylation domain-containing protein
MNQFLLKSIKHKAGFTLIEMIMVISLIGIVSNVVALMIYQGARSTLLQYELTHMQGESRIAIERLCREIRSIRLSSDLLVAQSSQIQFIDNQGQTITYSLSGDMVMRNTQPLVEHCTSFVLAYFDQQGQATTVLSDIRFIQIQLTLEENNHVLPLRTMVNLSYV